MMDLTGGNPGAMTCILELEQMSDSEECYKIEKFFRQHNFHGPTIYMLWSDLCGRDTGKLKAFILESSFYDSTTSERHRKTFF